MTLNDFVFSVFIFYRDPVSFWLRELCLVHESECTIMLQSKPIAEDNSSNSNNSSSRKQQHQKLGSMMMLSGGGSRDTIRAIQTRAHAISAVFAKLCR